MPSETGSDDNGSGETDKSAKEFKVIKSFSPMLVSLWLAKFKNGATGINMEILEEIKEKLGKRVNNIFEKNKQRYYIDITPEDIVEASSILFNEAGCRLATVTGIDTPRGIEILYHFSHDKTGKMFTLHILLIDKKKPEVNSIAKITKGAEWIEREIWEMLGVNFKGHPDLRRLLLAQEWKDGVYPLRKNKND